tara:strand:- start:526 stop:951 length:426 start_codon:yes stop_codon:yes gene_type:complete
MKSLLEIFLYLSGAISLFFLFPLFGMFSEELSLINVSKALLPIIFTGLLYLIYLKETKQKLITAHLEEETLTEGEVVNVFDGMPYSKKNGAFSEGVFFWVEEGKLLTTIEFHIEKGGDPDVFLEWVEQEKNNPRYLKPTLQ